MKKWLIGGTLVLIILLFAVFIVLGIRFLSLYSSLEGEQSAASPTSNVENYVSLHWSQYAYAYDEATQTLLLTKQTDMKLASAQKVGGQVYVDELAPETYLDDVSAIAVDVISHCDCPELTVILNYASVEGESIFTVSSSGTVTTCWEAEE